MMTTKSISTTTGSTWDYGNRVPLLMSIFTAVAIFGWVVSTFLSGIHFWAIPNIPADAELPGSLLVLTSDWAYILGIPLATLGAAYYLTTTIMAVWWLDTRHPLIIKLLTPITATGVIASAYFVYLQLGPIGAICPFCMMSAAASTVLFGLEVGMLRSSELPEISQVVDEAPHLVRSSNVHWLGLIGAMGVLTAFAFYGVTLAPVPGV